MTSSMDELPAAAHPCGLVVRGVVRNADDYTAHVKQTRLDDEYEEPVAHVVGENGLGYGLGAGRYMPIQSAAP